MLCGVYVHYCHFPSLQTLYTYPDNFRACKVLIAAQYSGAEIKVVSEPPEFVLGQTNKTSQFLDNFPLGKVPAFITADGNGIYESNAIAYYGKLTQSYIVFQSPICMPKRITQTL